MQDNFMKREDHFAALLETLKPEKLTLHNSLKHLRVETCYRNRTFIVYRYEDRKPVIIDEIMVNDFHCDDEDGASCTITSLTTKRHMQISYVPTQLWEHPIFMCIPLDPKLRWSATENEPSKGSLAFPMVIKVQSGRHARETRVVHCLTGNQFAQEFQTAESSN